MHTKRFTIAAIVIVGVIFAGLFHFQAESQLGALLPAYTVRTVLDAEHLETHLNDYTIMGYDFVDYETHPTDGHVVVWRVNPQRRALYEQSLPKR